MLRMYGIYAINMYVTYHVPLIPFTSRDSRSPVLSLTGMILSVINFQCCIPSDPIDDSKRLGAHEFGVRFRELPTLMGRLNRQRIHILIPCSIQGVYFWTSTRHRSGSRSTSSRLASAADYSLHRPPVVLRVIPQIPVDPILGHDCHDSALTAALDFVLNEGGENE